MRVVKWKAAPLFGAVILTLAACGSGPANPVDPVGGVTAAFDVARSGGVLKQVDLITCLTTGGGASSSLLTGLVGGFTADALAKAKISIDDLSNAWKISFENLQTTEKSKSGDHAIVHVTVKLTSEVDAGKFRDLVKRYLATQGVVPDDATIDAAIQAKLGGQLKMSATIDKDVNVVQQDGKWVACSGASGASGVARATTAAAATATASDLTPSVAPPASYTPATPGASGSGSTTIPNVSGNTVAIAAGNGFACALISGGTVKCWGKNDKGQLGNGTTTDSATPLSPSGLGAGVKSIAVDPFSSYACAVTSAGAVKCWGSDTQRAGTLGNGSLMNSSTPIDVTGLGTGASSVAASVVTACAVMSSGGVKCWGKNDQGQLGNNTSADSGVPVDVAGLTAATAVFPAQGSTCALTSAGGVKCWGNNSYANLGNGSKTNSKVPVDVTGLSSGAKTVTLGRYDNCALALSGGVKCWEGTRTVPTDVAGLGSGVKNIISFAAQATCALMDDGRILCWGSDPTPKDAGAGFRGLLTTIAIGADGTGRGANITCALTTSGGVACAAQADQSGWREITGLTPD